MQQDLTLALAVAGCNKACKLLTDRGGVPCPAMPGKDYQPGGIALFLEAPGADEEQPLTKGAAYGAPLVGRAGKLMNTLLYRAGLTRDEVLVMNRIRCRPPRNRIVDYPDAVLACDDWVQRELATYAPSVVVLCGKVAGETVFGANIGVGATRGTIRHTQPPNPYGDRDWIMTYHPSAALRHGGAGSNVAELIVTDLMEAKRLLNA
jgi:DNA polymerase